MPSAMRSTVTLHVVSSLDGFIAKKDKSVSWMDSSDVYEARATDDGDEVIEPIDCYVLGSRTYEHALQLGWPYGDTPTVVMTHRELPPRGRASSSTQATPRDWWMRCSRLDNARAGAVRWQIYGGRRRGGQLCVPICDNRIDRNGDGSNRPRWWAGPGSPILDTEVRETSRKSARYEYRRGTVPLFSFRLWRRRLLGLSGRRRGQAFDRGLRPPTRRDRQHRHEIAGLRCSYGLGREVMRHPAVCRL
jgi:hypothetical protein